MTVDPASAPAHVFLSCGEASGDRYGAALVAALRRRNPDLRFSALGGEALAAAGVEIVVDAGPLAVMGFGEIVAALPRLAAARRRLRAHLAAGDVDLCIPIDYPGFNMSLARSARRLGIPVFYLIAPQLWAWGGWRLGNLRRSVDRLGVVLPFEGEFFSSRGVPVAELGHPLVDDYPHDATARSARARESRLADRSRPVVLGLLPGSRRQETSRLLPLFLEALSRLRSAGPARGWRPVVSAGAGLPDDLVDMAKAAGCAVSRAPLPELLPELDLALVCSGTASLETALAGVPHAVAYSTSGFNYWLARRLVKVDRIGLANLVLGEDVVPEYIQGEATPAALSGDLVAWLAEPRRRAEFADRVARLRERLGGGGFWDRAAAAVLAFASGEAGGR